MTGLEDAAAHGCIVAISVWTFAPQLSMEAMLVSAACAALLIEAYWGVFRSDA